MKSSYIISQVLIVVAYTFLGIGLGKKSRKQILIYSTLYNILSAIHYILLSGVMGAVSNTIGLFRNLLFYYNEKRRKKEFSNAPLYFQFDCYSSNNYIL